jgi:hypothetical protein
LKRHAPPERTVVLFHPGPGYGVVIPAGVRFEPERDFQRDLDRILKGEPDDGTVTFLCDDDVVYRPWLELPAPAELLEEDDDLICWSLRLGANCLWQYPTGLAQLWPGLNPWLWQIGQGDFGYPGSVDGHVFRAGDVRWMLYGREYPNPTALECVLVEGCARMAAERPLMGCYPLSVLVGVPVNRVSIQSNVRHGEQFPAPAQELLSSFLTGGRLDLDAVDFSSVDAAHVELELPWLPHSVGSSRPLRVA